MGINILNCFSRFGLSLAMLIACVACNAQNSVAKTELRPVSTAAATQQKSKPKLEFNYSSSLDKSDDRIIRVKGTLVGNPHTSHRIDSARLLIGNQSYEAIDIDGIDFERYFQWEDDGIIPLEIDFSIPEGTKFPKIGKDSGVIFSTVYGEYIFDCK